MIVAILETAHFEFIALGANRVGAEAALCRGWNKHRRQTGATMTAAEALEEANFHELSAGDCLRDGSPLITG